MRKETYTILIDAVVSVAVVAVGIWVLPEYRDFALAVVAALQAVAGALVVEFRNERKIAALRTEVRSLTGRR